jgi:DNA-binding response OmpR family regulator
LDFNLPKKHGREVLQEVKSDEKIRQIPIVVLSTSSSEKDIRTAYDLHANSYLIKPWELEEFRALVHHLRDYWIHFAEITVTGQGV